MNYALAKELKDAGFPQGPKTRDHHGNGGWFDEDGDHTWHESGRDDVYAPVLHELIEECAQLTKEPIRLYVGKSGYCRATGDHDREEHVRQWCSGKTPDEAFARLYLALTKK